MQAPQHLVSTRQIMHHMGFRAEEQLEHAGHTSLLFRLVRHCAAAQHAQQQSTASFKRHDKVISSCRSLIIRACLEQPTV